MSPLGASSNSSVVQFRCGRLIKEKMKCLASPVQKLWRPSRGYQNLKSRSREPDHAPLGDIT